jgi:hypothetical protein
VSTYERECARRAWDYAYTWGMAVLLYEGRLGIMCRCLGRDEAKRYMPTPVDIMLIHASGSIRFFDKRYKP